MNTSTGYRTATLQLRGADHAFLRTLTFRDDMTGEELLDRLCIALGRFPVPDALWEVDGSYHGRLAAHFEHRDLSDDLFTAPLPGHVREARFILNRLDGWVFDVRFHDDVPGIGSGPVFLRDTTPLLPGPKLRLNEYTAVEASRRGGHLPPDLERTIIVDALHGLMTPEISDPDAAMELYTVLREEGRQNELRPYHHLMATVPDLEILHELLLLATSDKPPRVTRSGFLPMPVVRRLVGQFPALVPADDHGRRVHLSSAQQATTLNSVVELGRDIGILRVDPGTSLAVTERGRSVLSGAPGSLNELRAEMLRAWITQPVPTVPERLHAHRRLSFREYLETQEPRERHVDEEDYYLHHRAVTPIRDSFADLPPF